VNLEAELRRRFRPQAAAGMEMRLRLRLPGEPDLDLDIVDGELTVERGTNRPADVTFYFDDGALAWDLMTGRANAIDAFMHGRFRADGYLMMTFKLMELFDSVSLPPTPDD
jgi:putative sterol carrier protein